MHTGIDVSSLDGPITWPITAKRGITFATVRASWSTTYHDPNYLLNRTQALAESIQVIAYHWFVPYKDAIDQARNFTTFAREPVYKYMVDLEDTRYVKGYVGIGPQILAFLRTVEATTGQQPIIYTSPTYITSYLKTCPDLAAYPLVIAHWDAAYPLIPYPFTPTNWLAWQYTAKAPGPYFGIPQCQQCSLYLWNGPS